MKRNTVASIYVCAGFVLFSIGLWMIHPIAMIMVDGFILMLAGLVYHENFNK